MTDTTLPVVSIEEKQTWAKHWAERSEQLRKQGNELAECVGWYGNIESIGYESGQVRPGELGRWDMYFNVCMFLSDFSQRNEKAAEVAGLSMALVNESINEHEL